MHWFFREISRFWQEFVAQRPKFFRQVLALQHHCSSQFHVCSQIGNGVLGKAVTVWKIQDFCITQILREINFVDSRSAKTGAFAILGAVNFVHLVNFYLQKVQKFIKIQILSL